MASLFTIIQPTVFADVKDDMKIAREEVNNKPFFLSLFFLLLTLLLIYSTIFLPRDGKDFRTSSTNPQVQQHGGDCGKSQQNYLRIGCRCLYQRPGQSHVLVASSTRRNRLVFMPNLFISSKLWYV